MGMFKDMKDMVGVVRSDELKDLKRKADAQPKTSMMDGLKAANQAMDTAAEYQAMAGASGVAGANPFANANGVQPDHAGQRHRDRDRGHRHPDQRVAGGGAGPDGHRAGP